VTTFAGGCGDEFHAHTGCRDVIVAKILQLELAQPGDCRIAQRTRREGTVGLDEAHSQARVRALERTSTGCSAESAAHDDNARVAVLRHGRHRKNGGRSRHCSS
jgi:hypothetical protein